MSSVDKENQTSVSTEQTKDTGKSFDISWMAQVIGVSTFALYLFGFVVDNSYLSKWGITSFNLANSQYIAAGALFLVFSAIFWFLVGRRIFHMQNDYASFLRLGSDLSWRDIWSKFCLVYVFAEIIFAAIVAAYWTIMLFFPFTKDVLYLGIAISAYFVVDYFILVENGYYKRHPLITLPIAFFFHVSIIVVAFQWQPSPYFSSILAIYFGTGFVLNLIFDTARRVSMNNPYIIFWTTTIALGAAISFGATIYGHIMNKIGGGQPRHIEVVLNTKAPESLRAIIGKKGISSPLIMITETPSTIYLTGISNSTNVIRIAKDEVAAIVSTSGDSSNKEKAKNSKGVGKETRKKK